MAAPHPEPEFVGYPRVASQLDANWRLEMLGRGYFRLKYLFIVQVAWATPFVIRAMNGHAGSGFLVKLFSAAIGCLAFYLFNNIGIGLRWKMILPGALAVLLTINGPFWSSFGQGSFLALIGYTLTTGFILVLISSRARVGLCESGFVFEKPGMFTPESEFWTHLRQRELETRVPPVPANLFAGEPPAGTTPEVHG